MCPCFLAPRYGRVDPPVPTVACRRPAAGGVGTRGTRRFDRGEAPPPPSLCRHRSGSPDWTRKPTTTGTTTGTATGTNGRLGHMTWRSAQVGGSPVWSGGGYCGRWSGCMCATPWAGRRCSCTWTPGGARSSRRALRTPSSALHPRRRGAGAAPAVAGAAEPRLPLLPGRRRPGVTPGGRRRARAVVRRCDAARRRPRNASRRRLPPEMLTTVVAGHPRSGFRREFRAAWAT